MINLLRSCCVCLIWLRKVVRHNWVLHYLPITILLNIKVHCNIHHSWLLLSIRLILQHLVIWIYWLSMNWSRITQWQFCVRCSLLLCLLLHQLPMSWNRLDILHNQRLLWCYLVGKRCNSMLAHFLRIIYVNLMISNKFWFLRWVLN